MKLRSPNSYLTWAELAPHLGVNQSGAALPAQAACPLCAGRLDVFEDTTKGGAWHHCVDCGSAGDLLDLACGAWDTPAEAALERLARLGLLPPAALAPAAALARDAQRAADAAALAFWEECRRAMAKPSAEVNALRHRLCLQGPAAPERWLAGPGRVIGATSRRRAEALWCPAAAAPIPAGCWRSGAFGSAARLFRGPGWGDVVAVPYWDVPGRLRGFLFCGRRGGPGDVVFRRLPGDDPGGECGLAGLPLALEAPGAHVIGLDDPLLLARLQARHAGLSRLPLPLVAWRLSPGEATRCAWQCLGGRRLTLWAPAPDWRTWFQAIRTGADVSTSGPDEATPKAMNHYLRLCSAADLVAKIRRQAAPWPEALGEALLAGSTGAAEGLFVQLRRAGLDVRDAAERLRGPARECVEAALEEPPCLRSAVVAGEVVYERDGAWWTGTCWDQQRLTSFTVVVDAVAAGGVCRGSLRPATGGSVPFELTAAQARDPGRALQAVANRHHLGQLFVRIGWKKYLLAIAAAFAAAPTHVDA